MLTKLQGWAYDLHEVPIRATCKEATGASQDQFSDQHLDAMYCSQLKTRTQHTGESLQEFATTVKQLTHHVFPAQDDHVQVGACKAFINSIRDQGIKQQLFLGGKRTLNVALRQTLGWRS